MPAATPELRVEAESEFAAFMNRSAITARGDEAGSDMIDRDYRVRIGPGGAREWRQAVLVVERRRAAQIDQPEAGSPSPAQGRGLGRGSRRRSRGLIGD